MSGVRSLRAIAFLARSIRQESRLFSHHLIRGGLAGMVLFMFILQLTASSRFGAAGSRFATSIVMAFYWFLTILGLLYYSVAITEEKEEDTLPLLRMTGVSNFALLTGKSIPRLAIAALFLLVVSPFLVLSMTMGGVVAEQLVACLLGLLCYSFLLSQLGLLASTVARDGRRAFSLAGLLWASFELGQYLVLLSSLSLRANGKPQAAAIMMDIYGWLQERTLYSNLAVYLSSDRGDPLWFPQMTWHLLCGGICFLISWMLFEACNGHAIGQGGAAITSPPFFQRRGKQRRSALATGNALFWKSWHYLLGGRTWILVRLIGLPLATVMLVVTICLLVREDPKVEMVAVVLMILGTISLVVELARSLGRVLHDELFQQTLISLRMLPLKTYELVWPLVAGVLPVAIPSVACFGLGLLLLMASSPRDAEDFLETFLEPWFWCVCCWAVVTLHTGLFLSLYLRHGGMLLAVAVLWIAVPVLFVMTMMSISFLLSGADPGELFGRYLLPLGLIVVEVVICGLLQQLILRRVDQAVEQ